MVVLAVLLLALVVVVLVEVLVMLALCFQNVFVEPVQVTLK